MENLVINNLISEISTYENEQIDITDKVSFNQFETIKRITTHQNNGFTKRSNKKRFFFNIGDSRVDTGVKKIDLDTKNIDLTVVNGEFQKETFFLKNENKQFMKDTHQGEVLNDTVEQFVDMGNVVARKSDKGAFQTVNLKNLKLSDITARSLEETNVIEEFKYNITEFRKEGNLRDWENVDLSIKEFTDEKNTDVYVYSRYGEMSVKDFKEAQGKTATVGDEDKFIQTVLVASIDKPRSKGYIKYEDANFGHILFIEENEGEVKEDGKTYYKPYKEAHFGSYQGRWFRKGYREMLFDYQDRANILGNNIYEAMKWSNLHILWSKDKGLAGKNIFKSLQQGDIIKAQHLNVLPLEERNLSAQINEWNRLMDLSDKATQSFEVATGESLPSGTTLGSMRIQTTVVGQFFEYKREKLGLFFKDIYNDWVIDELISRINKEHFLTISPEYYEQFFEIASEIWLAENYLKVMALSGQMPTKQSTEMAKQMYKESLKTKPQKVFKSIRDFYKNIKVKFDIVITGESIDKQTAVNNEMALLQYIANPTIMQNPTAKALIDDIANKVGVNIQAQETPMQQQIPQQAPVPQIPQAELTTGETKPEVV